MTGPFKKFADFLNTPEIEDLTADRDTLREALDRLVRRLDEIHDHPDYQSVWHINQIHAGPYTGPTYKKEIEHAKAVLSTSVCKGEE